MVEDFERFWSIYPRKVAKGQARKTFERIIDGMPVDEATEFTDLLVGAVKSHISNRNELENTKSFVPPWKHPATWLGGECWNDELKSVYEIRESKSHSISCSECGLSRPSRERGWIIHEEKTYCSPCEAKKHEHGPTGINALRQAYKNRIEQRPGETGHSYIARVFGSGKKRSVESNKPEIEGAGGVSDFGPEDNWQSG